MGQKQDRKQSNRTLSACAAIVVVPILFADPDRFGKDDALARVLKRTPTIIGQIPTNDNSSSGVVRGIHHRKRLETVGVSI